MKIVFPFFFHLNMEKILFPRIHIRNIAFIGEIYFGGLLGAKVLRENFVVFEHTGT